MKVKKTSAITNPLVFVDLDDILDHPEVPNRELDKEHAKALSSSIEHSGLDTPLSVWDGGGEVEKVEIGEGDDTREVEPRFLISGLHRRSALEAYRKRDASGFKKKFPAGIPCVLRSGSLKDALCAQLRENVDRKDPSAEELLPFMITLRDTHKMKGVQIAKAIGKSSSFVSQVFDIEKELGEEGKEAVAKGEVSAKHAMKAAKSVKKARKAGKSVDKKAAVEEAKRQTKQQKDSGRKRAEKKPSLKKVYKAYKSLPTMAMGKRLNILEGAIQFLIGDLKALPKELRSPVKKSDTEKD